MNLALLRETRSDHRSSITATFGTRTSVFALAVTPNSFLHAQSAILLALLYYLVAIKVNVAIGVVDVIAAVENATTHAVRAVQNGALVAASTAKTIAATTLDHARAENAARTPVESAAIALTEAARAVARAVSWDPDRA